MQSLTRWTLFQRHAALVQPGLQPSAVKYPLWLQAPAEHCVLPQAALAQATPPARPPGAMGGSSGENDTAFEGLAEQGAPRRTPNPGPAPAGAGKAAAAQPMAHFAAFRPEAGERAEDVAAALLGKVQGPGSPVSGPTDSGDTAPIVSCALTLLPRHRQTVGQRFTAACEETDARQRAASLVTFCSAS